MTTEEKANVLFVDDEERILRSLRMLFRAKYNVFTTTDGSEAIEILKNNKIHVLVSDQRMPVMQGVELLRNAKAVSPNTMRLLLTGYSDLDAIVGSVNDGEIFRYISKPWNNDDIKERIEKAAEIALELEEQFGNTDPVVAETTETNESQENQPINILVIDDDAKSVALVQDVIKGQYQITAVSNLENALEILTTKPIAVVLSELSIQGRDISYLLKTLKENHPNIVSLVVTSFKDKDSLVDLINQAQIFRFLPKPLLKHLLERSLNMAVTQYYKQKQKPAVQKRYVVEKAEPVSDNTIPGRVMGLLKRLRTTKK